MLLYYYIGVYSCINTLVNGENNVFSSVIINCSDRLSDDDRFLAGGCQLSEFSTIWFKHLRFALFTICLGVTQQSDASYQNYIKKIIYWKRD